jgi:hypothetical protein
MSAAAVHSTGQWSWWRKLLFRFCCIYLLLYITPWTWLGDIPILSLIGDYYGKAETWLITLANQYIFHVKDVLVPLNGSGDTSYGYAQLCFFTLTAVVGAAGWTLFDRRTSYNTAYYWLLVLVRYFVAMMSLSYGIIKLFGLQMIFPSLSALATPLGDLLPMRFSWYFIGYSTPYQFFSGAVEVLAGLLLLFRRTSTLGALVAASVFLNVMMMNLCYDIPVKLFSIHLFVFSNFLLLSDAQRLLNFFVFNKPTQPAFRFTMPKKWMRTAQVVLKIAFVGLFLIRPVVRAYQRWLTSKEMHTTNKLATGFLRSINFRAMWPIAYAGKMSFLKLPIRGVFKRRIPYSGNGIVGAILAMNSIRLLIPLPSKKMLQIRPPFSRCNTPCPIPITFSCGEKFVTTLLW